MDSTMYLHLANARAAELIREAAEQRLAVSAASSSSNARRRGRPRLDRSRLATALAAVVGRMAPAEGGEVACAHC